MKKLFIRIALALLKKEMKRLPEMSYAELAKYGIEDVLDVPNTGEKAIVL